MLMLRLCVSMVFRQMFRITKMMDEIIVVESDDSENSIIELELPKKPTPPLIELDEEEVVLNISNENRKIKENCVLAKEFLKRDKVMGKSNKISNHSQNIPLNIIKNNPDHWTDDMIKFYNDDWGDEENFIVEKLQEKMDKSPYLWEISPKDIFSLSNKFKKSHIKCWNCNQCGHHMTFCPEPRKVPKCHMCGTPGHIGDRCPKAKCLNCGNSTKEYRMWCYKCSDQANEVCSRCGLRGHVYDVCSDHWRLFHLTTDDSGIKIPKRSPNKPDSDLWCSNCGRKGHIQCMCLIKNFRLGDTYQYVVSYQTAFDGLRPQSQKRHELPWKKNRKHYKEDVMRLRQNSKAIRKDKNQVKPKKMWKIRRAEKRKKKKRERKMLKGGPQLLP